MQNVRTRAESEKFLDLEASKCHLRLVESHQRQVSLSRLGKQYGAMYPLEEVLLEPSAHL